MCAYCFQNGLYNYRKQINVLLSQVASGPEVSDKIFKFRIQICTVFTSQQGYSRLILSRLSKIGSFSFNDNQYCFKRLCMCGQQVQITALCECVGFHY